MHSCLTLQHILLPLSCLCSQRLATQFSGLNITKICQHPLTEYTTVPIPRSNVILEIRREFWLRRRPAGSGLSVPGRARECRGGGRGGRAMPAVLTCSSSLGDGYGLLRKMEFGSALRKVDIQNQCKIPLTHLALGEIESQQ